MLTPIVTAAPALFLITLGYIAVCVSSPFGNCRKCRGLGFKTRTDRRGRLKRGRDCRRCQATGKRIRLGRRIHNCAARTWRAGAR